MDDVEGFRRLVRELNLEEISDVEEIKELCSNIDKYLEWRLASIKSIESEIFSKSVKLTEAKSKLINSVNSKIKQAEIMIPYQDCNLRKYFLNRVFCFDATSKRSFEVDEFCLPASMSDRFKGQLPTRLILKDSKGRVLEYLLVYSISSYCIQEVYNFNKEKLELNVTDSQEVASLISKLKSFVGENYCGTRLICINDLQKFLDEGGKDKCDTNNSNSKSQSSFFFNYDD